MSGELERFDPAEQRGRIAYEHLHRYALCREHVAGRRVLDMACGTGYGTAILGSSGAQVVGVDINATVIGAASRRHGRDNVKFQIADCFDLPFEDGYFDVVVANEMIEHVADHDGLLREARRVLAPNGLLLVSTPNKPVYNRFKTANQFHISEMGLPEFQQLLGRHFRHVRLTGTRMALVSIGFPLESTTASNLDAARIYTGGVFADGRPNLTSGELALADAEYLLAACSDEPLEDAPLPSSLFVDPADDLWLEHERIMAWASQLHEEDEILRADVKRTRDELAQERASLVALRTEHAEKEQFLEEMRQSAAEVRQAADREREAARREGGGQRQMLARLLGQAGGSHVDEDETSIVSGLFALNSTLVEERLRREMAEREAARQEVAAKAARMAADEAEAARTAQGAKLAETAAQLAVMQAARESAAIEAAATRQILDDRELALGIARDELSSAARKLAFAEDDATVLKKRLESAEASLTETTGKLEDAKAEHDQTANQLADVEQAAAVLAEQLQGAEAALIEATVQLEGANTERDQTAERLANVEQAAAELAEQLRGAEAALAETTGKLDDANGERDQAAQRLALAEADKTSTTQQLFNARQVAAKAAEDIAALRRELAGRVTEIEQLQKALAATRPATAKVADAASPATSAPDTKTESAAPDNNSAMARRQRLVILHQRVASELANAPERLAAAPIGQPPPPPRRSFVQRLLRQPDQLHTLIFSQDWLERQQAGAGRLSLAAYLSDPALHGLDPHPSFAASAYLARYPDVAAEGMSPLLHYMQHGWREGRNPHPLFPNDWYLARNPDVAADGSMNPLDHYLRHGWREGRWPNPLFNPRAYLDRYPDVAAAEIEPLTHFLMYGRNEGREPQFRGWDPDMADLIDTADGPASVMEHLLTAAPPPEARPLQSSAAPVNWPPRPLDDFWPTQAMRDFVLESHGEAVLDSVWYLLSLMERWQDRQPEFVGSDDCRRLLDRLRQRAALRTLPAGRQPDASIIIPVYNNILDTLICISSLLELDSTHDFEVIVADDGSSDATPALVSAIGGPVRHLRQPQNLGFLGNCNAAALQAHGRYIVLLNNDTLVLPGWLDGLLSPFARFEHVGLVGSKLINWDGTLQEAGGIFWQDGSAWNFGRNQDPRAPEFNYLKDVDYCSGAAIAIPADVWRAMEGFDPAYTPAYCEDSDLAFRLRDAGYRTLYSPASEVVHHEGRSHGRDVSSGIKAYQVANNERLFERWHHVLQRDHFPNAYNVLRARDRTFNKRHVLVVDHYVPQWDKDAGSRSMYEFMRVLIDAGHAVTFWPDNLWRDPDYTSNLQALGIEVIYGPRFRDGFARFMAERADLYDVVLLSRPHIAVSYLDAVRQHSGPRIVYYGHDVHFRRMMAQRTLEGRPAEDAEVAAMKAQELSVCNRSDLVLYPSADEAALMSGLVDPGVTVRAIAAYRFMPAELAMARATVLARRPANGALRLLFVGGFGHPPNSDAITWFCRDVLPQLAADGQAVRLTIVGSKAGPEIRALQGPGIDVLGFVSDAELLRLYGEADIVVAPLRYGAGVKGKVIEAMARGVPVVTTDVGAQGIVGTDQMLFIGNSASELAQAVIAANDADVARTRALAAIAFIDTHYSTQAMLEVLQAGLAPKLAQATSKRMT